MSSSVSILKPVSSDSKPLEIKNKSNQFYFYDQATCHVTKTRFNPAEIEKSVMIDGAKFADITNGAATSHQMIGTTGPTAGDSGS